MSDLKKIKDEFLAKLRGKLNLSEINQIKSDLFGKNGLVSSQFKKIGTIAESERKKFASDLNLIKDELQDLIGSKINEIENEEINKKLEEIYSNLNSWQRTQVARHEDRPKANFYIKKIFSQFTLLSGDRYFGDDKSVIAGFGFLTAFADAETNVWA